MGKFSDSFKKGWSKAQAIGSSIKTQAVYGYNIARSGKAGQAAIAGQLRNYKAGLSPAAANIGTMGALAGWSAGKIVNAISKLPAVGAWIKTNGSRALRFTWKGMKWIGTKILAAGRLLKVIFKALGTEIKNLVLDFKDRVVATVKGTKELYNLKKERHKQRHGKEPSAGTKARMAYDSFYQARVDAKDDMYANPRSKINKFKRDFGKKSIRAVRVGLRKATDIALAGAGIAGIIAAARSDD